MKHILEVSPERFDEIRKTVFHDETYGIDPGKRWKLLYPDATEIEFKVNFNIELPK